MKANSLSSSVKAGLAMFSMFFGAGNVVFPLLLGQSTGDNVTWAMLGLTVTAVIIPFGGLLSMVLWDGDYDCFFERLGRIPGQIIAFAILLLIGPFGALPRCIALSHATVEMSIPGLSLSLFSLLSCIIIFIMSVRPGRILDILGQVLTPILLISLAVLVIVGCLSGEEIKPSTLTSSASLWEGLRVGYNTMDLLAAFFFSHVVILCLKKELGDRQDCQKTVFKVTMYATVIGSVLLALVYFGFSYSAAFHAAAFANVSYERLLGALALHLLGPSAGIISVIAVSLSCLTTAIALAAVFGEYLQKDILKDRFPYSACLVVTLAISFGISTLEFSGIAKAIEPFLQVLYPSLIVLSCLNLAHKLWGTRVIKTPVVLCLVATIAFHLFG